jgi:hypothetical protein
MNLYKPAPLDTAALWLDVPAVQHWGEDHAHVPDRGSDRFDRRLGGSANLLYDGQNHVVGQRDVVLPLRQYDYLQRRDERI